MKKHSDDSRTDMADIEAGLGRVLWRAGRDAEAEAAFKRSIALFEKTLPVEAIEDAAGVNELYAEFLRARGRRQEAVEYQKRAKAIRAP